MPFCHFAILPFRHFVILSVVVLPHKKWHKCKKTNSRSCIPLLCSHMRPKRKAAVQSKFCASTRLCQPWRNSAMAQWRNRVVPHFHIIKNRYPSPYSLLTGIESGNGRVHWCPTRPCPRSSCCAPRAGSASSRTAARTVNRRH